MSAQHTPGPWRVEQYTTLIWGHCNPDDSSSYGMGFPVASATALLPDWARKSGRFSLEWEEAQANARLIAAAPCLLAALRGVVAVADRATPEFDAARAAIAKATGA